MRARGPSVSEPTPVRSNHYYPRTKPHFPQSSWQRQRRLGLPIRNWRAGARRKVSPRRPNRQPGSQPAK